MNYDINFFEEIGVELSFSDAKKAAIEAEQSYLDFFIKSSYSASLDGLIHYKSYLEIIKSIKKTIYDLRKNKLNPYKAIANQPYNQQRYLYIKGRFYKSLRNEAITYANVKWVKFAKNYNDFFNYIAIGSISEMTEHKLNQVRYFFENHKNGLIKITKIAD